MFIMLCVVAGLETLSHSSMQHCGFNGNRKALSRQKDGSRISVNGH